MKKLSKIISVCCAVLLLCFMFSGCGAETAAPAEAGVGASSWSGIIMIVALFVVFYFFMIRPENKKKKKLAEMRDALSVGDKITTIGGIVGKVVAISGDLITFETGEDRVRLQVTKWAISSNSIEKDAEQR